MKLVTVVGARPQFVKAAVVSRAIKSSNTERARDLVDERIIHTGQHDDPAMSDVFFAELSMPGPRYNLGLSGGSHGRMTARMLEALEACFVEEMPDWVLVYGDTNSTLAAALAAAKLKIPVAHVEAGLRCYDRSMPEELNRLLTDHCAELLLAPTPLAVKNLELEGLREPRVRLVGDVMYDASVAFAERARHSDILARLRLEPRRYVLATVHRAENTDDAERLTGVFEGLMRLAVEHQVVCPLHPRTRTALTRAGLIEQVSEKLRLCEPVGYLDMTALELSAGLIVTDSGGVQKEAYFHGVHCLILREATEWRELVEMGASILVGAHSLRLVEAARANFGRRLETRALYGAGRAAEAVVECLLAL